MHQESKRTQVITVLLATFGFGLLAHAFCYFNLQFSHDALEVVNSDALIQFKMGLGRYLQPVLYQLRGRINAPWLIGTLELAFLSVAAYLVLDLFEIKKPGIIVAVCGIMCTNITLISLNSTFFYDADSYMMALVFATAAAWATCKYKWGFLYGAVLLVASLALYQAYVAVFIALIMLYAIDSILRGKRLVKVLTKVLIAVGCLCLGGILYKISLIIMTNVTGVALSDGYNGVAGVTNFSDVSVWALLKKAYQHYFVALFSESANQTWFTLATKGLLLVVTLFAGCCCLYQKRTKWPEILFVIAVCLVFPFGVNIICFVSKGLVYELMTYAFCLTYMIPALVLSRWFDNPENSDVLVKERRTNPRVLRICERLFYGCCAIVIVCNIICANQAYTKKVLAYDASKSIVTRLLCRMEMTEGYVSGETPVLFIGELQDNRHYQVNYVEFSGLNSMMAMGTDMSITYRGTEEKFFKYVMNTDVLILSPDEAGELLNSPEAAALTVFPEAGFCRMIDGVMVAKLAE